MLPPLAAPLLAAPLAAALALLAARARLGECAPSRVAALAAAAAGTGALAAPAEGALVGAAVAAILAAAAAIDLWRRILPDLLTLPLLAGGLAAGAAGLGLDPASRALGAALGYAALWAFARLWRSVRGREGLGPGDAKLLAAGGAWTGPEPLAWIVLAAAAGALAAALARSARGEIAFGPWLAAAIWGAMALAP